MNNALPKGVYEKHGAYYTVKRNRWIRLGTDLESAISAKAAIETNSAEASDVAASLSKIYVRSRQNAKGGTGRRKKDFSLTLDDVMDMYKAQHGACAVSSVPFDLTIDPLSRRRPFAPSIDRIDSREGYHKENCRLVCVAVNFAMNAWGESVLSRIVRHMGGKIDSRLDSN